MKRLQRYFIPLASIALVGCGGGGSQVHGNATIKLHIATAHQTSVRTRGIQQESTFPTSEATSIASGQPDEMDIYIKSIKLKQKDGPDRYIYKEDHPKPLTIHNGKVDISGLFQAQVSKKECFYDDHERITYDDKDALVLKEGNTTIIKEHDENGTTLATFTCDITNTKEFNIPATSYTDVIVEYSRRAKIKGCVEATFSSYGTKEGIGGHHKYCTQADKSSFSGIVTQNSDFENKTPQLMDVDLKIIDNGVSTDPNETFEAYYTIPDGGITLQEGKKSDLTLLFDLNRMLRYFNDGRDDNQPTNPHAPTGMTYFFTLNLDRGAAAYAFVGEVGKIYGYKMVAQACSEDLQKVGDDYVCPENAIGESVPLWMTSIYSQNGTHMVTNFMPDDNNDWTIVKGTASGEEAIRDNSDGTFDITYTLGTDEDGREVNGTILHFKHAQHVGDEVHGATFEGLSLTNSMSDRPKGKIFALRKL